MPLTRSFKDTVMARIRRDPEFAKGMLIEGINSLLGDEVDVGKDILRDYINATLGFEKLGKKVGLPPKSLMRMFGSNGNPTAKNLFAVIAALQKGAGIQLKITNLKAVKRPSRQRNTRGKRGQYEPVKVQYSQAPSRPTMGFAEDAANFKRR